MFERLVIIWIATLYLDVTYAGVYEDCSCSEENFSLSCNEINIRSLVLRNDVSRIESDLIEIEKKLDGQDDSISGLSKDISINDSEINSLDEYVKYTIEFYYYITGFLFVVGAYVVYNNFRENQVNKKLSELELQEIELNKERNSLEMLRVDNYFKEKIAEAESEIREKLVEFESKISAELDIFKAKMSIYEILESGQVDNDIIYACVRTLDLDYRISFLAIYNNLLELDLADDVRSMITDLIKSRSTKS